MTVIDLTLANSLLDQALALKGADHVQNVCNYVVADGLRTYSGNTYEYAYHEVEDEDATPKPGCIVGTALWLHDEAATLSALGTSLWNGELIDNSDVLSALETEGVTLTPEARVLFSRAQTLQDGRSCVSSENLPWGEAVRIARQDDRVVF